VERENCLTILIVLIGGTMLLACGWWPACNATAGSARRLERLAWRAVWLPVVPALLIAAWFCGWALVEPDPIPEAAPMSLMLMSAPLGVLVARAALRAGWALIGDRCDLGTATVGLLRALGLLFAASGKETG